MSSRMLNVLLHTAGEGEGKTFKLVQKLSFLLGNTFLLDRCGRHQADIAIQFH